MDDKVTALPGGWEGYRVGTVGRKEAGEEGRTRPEVWVELHPIRDHARQCGGCGRCTAAIHDTSERRVRDLPVFDAGTHLLVHRVRVKCPACGPKVEALPWLEPYARVTARLAESVARMCTLPPVTHAADSFALDCGTVKRIDKAYLARELGPVDRAGLAGAELLAMDEFAVEKGHRYATVVIDPRVRRVLWVGRGRGRGREDVRPFFDLLGDDGRRRVKAVAMDMNGAYAEEVRARCPNAEVVYDLFHVVMKYVREVVGRVRVDEANRLGRAGDRAGRKVVKSARWRLLRNRENVSPGRRTGSGWTSC